MVNKMKSQNKFKQTEIGMTSEKRRKNLERISYEF